VIPNFVNIFVYSVCITMDKLSNAQYTTRF